MTSPDRRSLAAWAVLLGLCLGASACVSSYVLVGKARPPIAPDGVLLANVDDQAVGSVGTGVGSSVSSGHLSLGIGVSSSSTHYEKSGSGLAIYVEP